MTLCLASLDPRLTSQLSGADIYCIILQESRKGKMKQINLDMDINKGDKDQDSEEEKN